MILRLAAPTRAAPAVRGAGCLFALLALLLAGWAFGAPPPVREIGAVADGSRVTLAPSQLLRVTVDSNPATGYRWVIDRGAATVLQPVGDPVYTPISTSVPLVGAGGTTTFEFVAAAVGSDMLQLAYRHAADRSVAPARSFRIEVVVQ